jgi:hypothetical protein
MTAGLPALASGARGGLSYLPVSLWPLAWRGMVPGEIPVTAERVS